MSFLMDKTLREFSSLLASSEPAPGGGSSAAFAGVLGTSLTMMVVNLSVGKKAYEALDENIRETIQKDFETIESLNKTLTGLVDEDTKAFNLFMEAVKMPKDSEEDKAKRTEAMQKASLYALEVPLAAAEKCLLLLKHQWTIASHGNKNAVSDIGVGALLALAGLEGASLNVKINLPGISDDVVKRYASEKIDAFLEEGRKLKAEIMGIVNKRIEEM